MRQIGGRGGGAARAILRGFLVAGPSPFIKVPDDTCSRLRLYLGMPKVMRKVMREVALDAGLCAKTLVSYARRSRAGKTLCAGLCAKL